MLDRKWGVMKEAKGDWAFECPKCSRTFRVSPNAWVGGCPHCGHSMFFIDGGEPAGGGDG